ncbi:MAG: cellulase family glycosylhydrolase, partial [Anaerolineales bacterium]|nr:cellulase family glycosylhydrolase [Anaerolineales bacterium]
MQNNQRLDRQKSYPARCLIGLLLLILISSCGRSVAETAVSTPTATPPQPTATATPTRTEVAAETAVSIPTLTPTPGYPIYTGTPLRPDQMGIQVHLRDEDQDVLFAHLTALGVGWVKVQISWKLYQPHPDAFHAERFAELDQFVQTANAYGIRVLLGVSKAPEWSRPTTELDGPPADFTLFETFMAYLANRYQGQVVAYELWNEPNLQREWNGRSLSAADLVELIRMGANGVRQYDADAVLISAAPATT